jgi:alkanesulfonate monooxygenase SsuD/methylene tetrahydromethanopterin reductase-like flavin-dependent oxidoreductase (luciferase family)
MAIEAAEQIANMMVLEPYPGFSGKYFTMPCRNVLPKPIQHPHPPMWMACTNRDTIKVAASLGLGALAFSFVNPDEARVWSEIYYGIIKSEHCIPLGHSVNAEIAMVSGFSVHRDRAEAIRRGHEGFEFFAYALNALVAHDTVPGRTNLWGEYLARRGDRTEEIVALTAGVGDYSSGIGTPEDMHKHLSGFQEAGIDQVIFLQQAGRNSHEHICQSLELFAAEVMPEFKAEATAREQRKAAVLAPYVEAALKRKAWMKPLADHEIPVVKASVARAQVAGAPKTAAE